MTLSNNQRSTLPRIWADIGGTFTDCFVQQQNQRLDIKVLSSGLMRAAFHSMKSEFEICLQAYPGSTTLNFWKGASASVLNRSGKTIHLGVIDYQDSAVIRFANNCREAIANLQGPLTIELNAHIEAPVLATRLLLNLALEKPLPAIEARLGTTRGTNALLTRAGAKMALIVTKGFGDLLKIGEQDRPDLFTLQIHKYQPLANQVIEIDERMDSSGKPLRVPEPESIMEQLKAARAMGIESLAICLLHSHLNGSHEKTIEAIARECGFKEISRSSEVAPLIKYVSRAETTSLDAYLNPILRHYINRVWNQFGGKESCNLRLMTSNGNLVVPDSFRGRDSILSGPAGGVVGLGEIAKETGHAKIIGLDMGGTSTDVSRYEDRVGRCYESRVAGIRVMTPMMDIETVAAGGGSICTVSQGGRLNVGPSSAGAEPGPACYGKGGPLTVTDINLLLGRIAPEQFPFPFDIKAAKTRLEQVAQELTEPALFSQAEQLADGFFDIAVTHMAEAVRTVSTAQGSDVRHMALAGFGGAAGQHLCRIAETLGMTKIIDHPDSGLLSALGIGIAKVGNLAVRGIYQPWNGISDLQLDQYESAIRSIATEPLTSELRANESIQQYFEIDLRYQGTESPLTLPLEPKKNLANRFHKAHMRTFGYKRADHGLELVALRCEATIENNNTATNNGTQRAAGLHDHQNRINAEKIVSEEKKIWHQGRWIPAKKVRRETLKDGEMIKGPALITGRHSTLVLESGWTAIVGDGGIIQASHTKAADATIEKTPNVDSTQRSIATDLKKNHLDPVLLEVISRRLQGIADAMGEVLRRTSISVNVKERRDYSCAIFTASGTLVANAPHVPVHLGAMGHTVRNLIAEFPTMYAGDCYLSNDPFAGGSHLPDITAVTPVFCGAQTDGAPDYFVASRAHHAEIGGISPGSMPPDATSLAEEGVLIQAFPLVRNGEDFRQQLIDLLSAGEYPSRCPNENIADISAQQAAGLFGARSLLDLTKTYSIQQLDLIMSQILNLSGDTVQRWIQSLPSGQHNFEDKLDDNTPLGVMIEKAEDKLHIQFQTGPVHPNGFNATPAIVTAAVLYVFRCLAGSELPLCEGALRDVKLSIPSGLLNPPHHRDPHKCVAVVAGNVETSQRVVDVLFGALKSAAGSQGTMNNLLLGNEHFGYYETIAGGSGATASGKGADAVHTHMTNTRITDPEILETRLPVRLLQFAIRRGSGGRGKNRGGDGVIREFEFLEPLVLSLITSRRTTKPYGIHEGLPGQAGKNLLYRNGTEHSLGFKTTTRVKAGDRLVIETPGGGGWGRPPS